MSELGGLEGRSRKQYRPARINLGTAGRIAQNLADSDFMPGKQRDAAMARALTLGQLMLSAGVDEGKLADVMGWFLAGVRTRIVAFLPEDVQPGRLKLWVAGGRTLEGGKIIKSNTDIDLILSFEGDDSWKNHLDEKKIGLLEKQFNDLKAQLNEKLSNNGKHIVDVLGVGHMLSDAEAEKRRGRTDRPFLEFATETL